MLRRFAVVALLAVVLVPFAAVAQEVQQDQDVEQADEWGWRITPYFWMSGLDGKVGVFGGLPATSVSADFGDIFDVTDFGFMLNTEKRFNETWGFTGDWTYLALSADADLPAAVGGGEVELESKMFIAQPMAAYRVAEGDDYMVDVLGGLRLWSLDNDVEVKSGPNAGLGADDKETWADPVVGVKTRYDLTEKWFANFQGDLGGFGVGSDFTWMAQGGVGYRFTDSIAGHLMYRYLDVDYDENDIVWDVTMEGVLVGVSFVF